MRIIHDTEFPNSVDATQKLMDEQGSEYERLKVKKKWLKIKFIKILMVWFWHALASAI